MSAAHRRLLIAIVAVAAMLRLCFLTRWPDVEADEGLWTTSTKNFVAFGDWFMDGRTHMLLSPAFHGLSAVSFGLFGPSMAAARAVSAVAGTFSVLLVWVLLRRLGAESPAPILAAALLATSQWAIELSRRALVEPLQLAFLLLGCVLLSGRARWTEAAGAGLAFAAALLAKMNAGALVFVLPVGIVLAAPPRSEARRYERWASTLLAWVVAGVIAGVGYGALYLKYPERFWSAFRFELDGQHFAKPSHLLFQVGRFGIDPVQIARTTLALFTEDPFLLVLVALGLALYFVRPTRCGAPFATWVIVGGAFLFAQIFQPLRYFYLLIPGLAAFAALTLAALAVSQQTGRARRLAPVLAFAPYGLFNLAHLGASVLASSAPRLPQVTAWVRAHTARSDNVMAASYFCTDLPNRAYGFYKLVSDSSQLLETVTRYNIRYVIVDDEEWPPPLRRAAAREFELVQTWPFGAVYRVQAAKQARSGG